MSRMQTFFTTIGGILLFSIPTTLLLINFGYSALENLLNKAPSDESYFTFALVLGVVLAILGSFASSKLLDSKNAGIEWLSRLLSLFLVLFVMVIIAQFYIALNFPVEFRGLSIYEKLAISPRVLFYWAEFEFASIGWFFLLVQGLFAIVNATLNQLFWREY